MPAPESDDAPAPKPSFLRRFPNTAYGIVLGLSGNSILWGSMRNASFIEAPAAFQWFFWVTGIAVWLCFTILYGIKAALHLDIVKKEWHDNIRGNFFQAPNFAIVILALGCPTDLDIDRTVFRVIWVITFVYQLIVVLFFYNRWMFTDAALGSAAVTPYLLNVVGWFLLTNLGTQVDMHEAAGLDLASFSFGIGVLFCTICYVDIFNNLHHGKISRGHPAMFLLLAPPSVSALSLQALLGGWTAASKAVFGAMVFLLMLLLLTPIVIFKEPTFLGIYWAYVFPLAALATAGIANANAEDSFGARLLAWVLIFVSQIALLGVFLRMSFHCGRTVFGTATWNDPLVVAAPATVGATDQVTVGATDQVTEVQLDHL